MQKIGRRLLLLSGVAGAVTVLLTAAWHGVLDHYGGTWSHAPEDAAWVLPQSAWRLVNEAFDDIGAQGVSDRRVTIISQGQLAGNAPDDEQPRPDSDDRTVSVWGRLTSWLHARLRRDAAGIRDADFADAEYISRLLRQMRAMPGGYRSRIFARDAVYTSHGKRDDAATDAYVSNAYVVWLAARAPYHLMPVVSVHPNRRDARAALSHWADAGVRDVSWLPVAQHIDLAGSPALAAYGVMAGHDMTLHTRVGGWHTDRGASGYVAPDALRPALDAGVTVSVEIGDVDAGGGHSTIEDLFALLRDPDYASQLSIELAGVLAPDRIETVLAPLLQHPQFFGAMRYASNYPGPALARAIDVRVLTARGYLDTALVAPLRAIYDVNPLLYALVTMRNVHLPATGLHFPVQVFLGGRSQDIALRTK